MPTGIEEITLGYKILSLSWEVGRILRNAAKGSFSRVEYRILSSLTTIEFRMEGNDQIAHVVQDRTVKILRNKTAIPPFVFGTDGEDTIERILVNNGEYKPRLLEDRGRAQVVTTDDDTLYSPGTTLRCILIATAKNGFIGARQDYMMPVTNLIDSATTFIIFPRERPPQDVTAEYRKIKDTPGRWRDVQRDIHELRHFTGGRKAYILEIADPPFGHEYKIHWNW